MLGGTLSRRCSKGTSLPAREDEEDARLAEHQLHVGPILARGWLRTGNVIPADRPDGRSANSTCRAARYTVSGIVFPLPLRQRREDIQWTLKHSACPEMSPTLGASGFFLLSFPLLFHYLRFALICLSRSGPPLARCQKQLRGWPLGRGPGPMGDWEN